MDKHEIFVAVIVFLLGLPFFLAFGKVLFQWDI